MPISFSTLYHRLSETTRQETKIALLAQYLALVPQADLGWAVRLICGGSCKGPIRSRDLKSWAAEFAAIPDWLFQESYTVVGDLAETIALLVGARNFDREQVTDKAEPLIDWIDAIKGLTPLDLEGRKQAVLAIWQRLSSQDLLVFNKILTGALRIGVSKGLLARALARNLELPPELIWERLTGNLAPEQISLESLKGEIGERSSIAPYPFFLAQPFNRDVGACGDVTDWRIEWKWDGIRAQIVRREGKIAIWSRGDELISESFPELVDVAKLLPNGTVLDGEIVAWRADKPASFFDLQKRLNRRVVTQRLIKEHPIKFIAYDILEEQGKDLRQTALSERVKFLADYIITDQFLISKPLNADSWQDIDEQRLQARTNCAEGVMLKRLDSTYGIGRTQRGVWWKWKLDPFSIDGVLIYAQKGHGRRAGLYTDYTFGVWDGDKLVPFAKAYSGLTDKEIVEVDAFIKRNTEERFGPVRTVRPELVFEIGFEAIQGSKRHRSGVAVRFPRMLRWRRDKPASEADTIEALRGLVADAS